MPGGRQPHAKAAISSTERRILRTGKMHGKSGKEERRIMRLREAALRQAAEAATAGKAAATTTTSGTGSSSSAEASSSAAAAAAKADGDLPAMRRVFVAREKEKAERAAAATTATPAAASFLASLRAEMSAAKDTS